MKEKIQKLKDSAKLQKALAFIEKDADRTLDQQIELALIPAFSNHEEKKAARFREMIEEMGYETVQDEVSNTFAVIPGPEGSPVVMVSAHLDTVFPLETPLTLRRDGAKVCLPGICDDTRGCAEVLAMLRAMQEADIKPACTLHIGGDSGEVEFDGASVDVVSAACVGAVFEAAFVDFDLIAAVDAGGDDGADGEGDGIGVHRGAGWVTCGVFGVVESDEEVFGHGIGDSASIDRCLIAVRRVVECPGYGYLTVIAIISLGDDFGVA